MELTLPVYVEVRREGGQTIHYCRPLFSQQVHGSDAHLGLAMSKLSRRLKPLLDALGAESRHHDLAAWAFSPPLETHLLKLSIELKERIAKTKLLFIVFPALDRQIAFSPSLPDVWFELAPGDRLPDRAAAVLTHHFRQIEKNRRRLGDPNVRPEDMALAGQAWITTIDMQVTVKQASAKKVERKLMALFDETKVDGGTELQRVGRCLNWLYPDELHRAVSRDAEVDRLLRLLEAEGNRPVAIVGPRLSGKTTVLHECVRRRVARRGKPFAAKQNVWLLSPQRLVSGMMYVGQWEGRVEAILKEARKRRHVLYFDDFLGLYHAGISRDAHLSIADMLRPYVLRRQVRVLAEMTPEAFQSLQERDRGLADQFDVLRIEAMGDDATRRVMLQVHRDLESQHHARFELDTLPMVLQLQRSYIRDAAFPGKAAAFSRQIAQKHANQAINRDAIFSEFHQRTGLSLALLDDRRRLTRDEVLRRLRAHVVAQDEAVEAAADVVTVAKARLASPDRPLATLLFLGPTGVGKTQCARALAEVMFSDAHRLLRFDMNEYVTPHAVAQLVGTFAEPDGLLTSAVRRQPFSVVLLDEIEKAHPDVFDLLLQVTGEGRLTDALGRTADFSNAVIVMTSNLGTSAGQQLGLAPEQITRRQTFIKAAENYFRPEFFNRIDRVIPFDPLSREEMRKIAEMVLANVFQRDGLVRRRCALSVESSAMERIVDAGYHPHFGARALKRAIERQLVQPVAASLAGVKPELPAVISIYPQPAGVTASVQPLESVPAYSQEALAALASTDQLLRFERFLERATDEVEALRPVSASSGRGVPPEQLRYFTLKEQLHLVRSTLETARRIHTAQQATPVKPGYAPRQVSYTNRLANVNYRDISERRILREIQAADDIHDYLRDSVVEAPKPGDLQEQLTTLRQESALLHAMLASVEQPQQALVVVRPIVSTAYAAAARTTVNLFAALSQQMSFGATSIRYMQDSGLRALEFSGLGLWPILQNEVGVHVWCKFHENLLPVAVSALPRNEQSVDEQITAYQAERNEWLDRLARGDAAIDNDPAPLGRIVRFYDEAGPTLDLRSSATLPNIPNAVQYKSLILAGLALPPELEVSP